FIREDPADEHGEFAVRGGILDIFPAGEAQPVRLEFVGDTIESMRRYDPATQRSVETVDRITVVPLQDILARLKPLADAPAPQDFTAADLSRIAQGVDPANLDRSATILDYMKLAADSQVIVSEPDEVEANAMKLVEQLRQSYEEALHRKQRSLAPTDLFA